MGNALERLQGNVQVAHRLLQYLQNLPAYCCPQAGAAQYAEAGIGSVGFTCAFNQTNGCLESYAALVPASSNKLYWLGTFVSGVDFLSRRVAMTQTDAVALCCVLLFVNNLEPCVSLMQSGRLENAWGTKLWLTGGALALMVLEMNKRNTGITWGASGSNRFQSFSACWRSTSLGALDRVVLAMKRRCDNSRARDFSKATDADIQNENKLAMSELATVFAGAVTSNKSSSGGTKRKANLKRTGMIHQHVVHALAATWLLHPLRLLEHAEISDKNSNAEKVGYDGDFNVLKENVGLDLCGTKGFHEVQQQNS